jgi:hypothetical protein
MPSTSRVHRVTPNSPYFRDWLAGSRKSQEGFAQDISISASTLRTILRGGDISHTTMSLISKKAKRPFHDLILTLEEPAIPSDPKLLGSISYSYYIDNNRDEFGNTVWLEEKIKLFKFKKIPRKNGSEIVTFKGEIKNTAGASYDIDGTWVNRNHLVYTAIRRDKGSKNDCFTATFYKCLEKSILLGIWTGVDHTESRMSVYGIIMSTKRIPQEEVSALAKNILVKNNIKAPAETMRLMPDP